MDEAEGSESAAGGRSGGCGRSGKVNDRWDCRIRKEDSVALALFAGAHSEFGTFGMLSGELRGLDN
jgi:hypothetical protein